MFTTAQSQEVRRKGIKDHAGNDGRSDLDKSKLHNLASGRPLPDDVAAHLLSVEERGKLLLHEFNNRLCNEEDTNLLLFDPIKRVYGYPGKDLQKSRRKLELESKAK